MENRLAQQYSDFLNNTVLRPLAEFVKSQPDEISNKDIEGLIQRFQNVLQLPASSIQHHAPPSTNYGGMQNHLPSNTYPHNNFSPPMVSIPGLGSGLGAPAPQKPAGGRGRGSKAAKVEPPWYSIEQFTAAIQQGQKICAYCPPRSAHKDSVCGAPAVNADTVSDYKKWRCAADASKVGQIEKKLNNPIVGVVPPTFPGFNAPSNGYTQTGVQTRAQTANSRPQLPNFPNIPNGIPGLPAFPSLQSGLPGFPSLNGTQGANALNLEPPQSQPEQQELEVDEAPGSGLKSGHYLTLHPQAPKWLVDGAKMVIMGKFKYPIETGHKFRPDYEQDLIPLTPEEQDFAKTLGVPYENANHTNPQGQIPSVQATGPLAPIQTLGGLPANAGLPGLPSLPAIPSLAGLGLPGLG